MTHKPATHKTRAKMARMVENDEVRYEMGQWTQAMTKDDENDEELEERVYCGLW